MKTFLLLLSLSVGATIADVQLSHSAMQRGGIELSPLMPRHVQRAYMLHLPIVTAMNLIGLHYRSKLPAAAFTISHTVGAGSALWYNEHHSNGQQP